MHSHFHPLKIINKTFETQNAVSITFAIPENLIENYTFHSGQYVSLDIIIDDEKIRRSYSICSLPNNNYEITITIKAITNGKVSNYIKDFVKIGNTLQVGTPEGKFVLEPNVTSKNNYFLLAAGSGITPIFSILNTILQQEPESTVTLLYGNKLPEETIFYKEILALTTSFATRFNLNFAFSQVNFIEYYYGRINLDILNEIVNKNHQEYTCYYLCGPEFLIKETQKYLIDKKVTPENIKFELFDSQEVVTKKVSKNENLRKTKISVTLEDEVFELEIDKNKNILTSLLENNIDVPYSCQKGNCSSCVAKINNGNVDLRKNNALMEEEVAGGFVLTCQSYPVSNDLTISFDEY